MKNNSIQGSIRVISKRKGGTSAVPGEFIIDVDRTNPILGNRHLKNPNLSDKSEHARVIEAHADEFEADCLRSGAMFMAISRLADRVKAGERMALRCWCARPDRDVACHADIYKDKIAELAGLAAGQPKIEQFALFG